MGALIIDLIAFKNRYSFGAGSNKKRAAVLRLIGQVVRRITGAWSIKEPVLIFFPYDVIVLTRAAGRTWFEYVDVDWRCWASARPMHAAADFDISGARARSVTRPICRKRGCVNVEWHTGKSDLSYNGSSRDSS